MDKAKEWVNFLNQNKRAKEWTVPPSRAGDIADAIDQLLAERDRLRELLVEIEWKGPMYLHEFSQTYHIACPLCGNPKELGHHNWCRIAALLKDKGEV